MGFNLCFKVGFNLYHYSTDMLRSETQVKPDAQSPHRVDGEGLEFHICHAPRWGGTDLIQFTLRL
jgi:hypothetical protein